MNNQPTIKIVRLQTGEDIISSIVEDNDTDMILLTNPMRMIVKRMPSEKGSQSVFMMMPWLPIEVIKEDSAIIYNSDVITMFDPKDSLIEYYQNMVNESILTMLYSDDESAFEEEDEVEITEEELEEIERYKEGKLLH
jgi:hypothetical protein